MHTCLGGPFEALFDARAGDDVLAVAEADAGPQGAVLVPEGVELPVQPPTGDHTGFSQERQRGHQSS